MKHCKLTAVSLVLAPLLAWSDDGSPTPAFWGGESDVAADAVEVAGLDCREVFPVATLPYDPALQGLLYSAIGWRLDAEPDDTRTVAITALSGALVGGAFVPDDGAEEITVMSARTGTGSYDWKLQDIPRRVSKLTHTVSNGSAVDAGGTLVGYLDFTHSVSVWASREEVEAAVMGEITHPISVVQDEDWPWQPIDETAARSGIASLEMLEDGDDTATAFTFKGRGTLHYDYRLTGGMLEVVADDETVSTFDSPTAGWVSCQVAFEGYGAHEIVFGYEAAGGGATAAIRNVRWEEPVEDARMFDAGNGVRVDLRGTMKDGVMLRTPKMLAEVLPFQYSSTNWVGFAVGKSISFSAESVARVTIVQLEGTDPDVRNWTVVPNTLQVLEEKVGEGQIRWRPTKGVWKATFEIKDGGNSAHTESAIFDLRKAKKGSGFAIILT